MSDTNPSSARWLVVLADTKQKREKQRLQCGISDPAQLWGQTPSAQATNPVDSTELSVTNKKELKLGPELLSLR